VVDSPAPEAGDSSSNTTAEDASTPQVPEAEASNSNATAEDTSTPTTAPGEEQPDDGAVPIDGSESVTGAGSNAASELSASQEATKALQKQREAKSFVFVSIMCLHFDMHMYVYMYTCICILYVYTSISSAVAGTNTLVCRIRYAAYQPLDFMPQDIAPRILRSHITLVQSPVLFARFVQCSLQQAAVL
jgi:hypothetical protein